MILNADNVNIPDDLLTQLYNAKGNCLLMLEKYDEAEIAFLKALDVINSATIEQQFKYALLKGCLYFNLSECYLELDRLDNAYIYVQMACKELLNMFSDIDGKHSHVFMAFMQKAIIEEQMYKYLDAFKSYCILYKLSEDEECINYINDCFLKATKNKKYSKSKDYKRLKKEYQLWSESNKITNNEE